jgi:hypothetical protein
LNGASASTWCHHVDEADGLAGRVEIERADVQVGQLFRREQREAALAHGDDGHVVGQVVVGGDARAVADPDAGQRGASAERDIVVGTQAGQRRVDRRRAHVQGAGPRLRALAREFVQYLRQARARRLVVEAGHVGVVEEAALDLRRAEHRMDGRALVETAQVGVRAVRRLQAGLHERPAAGEAAHHIGARGAQHFVRNDAVVRRDVAHAFSGRLHGRGSCGR